MFGASSLLIRRLGLVCLMLLTIAVGLPTAEAQACGSASTPEAAASAALQTAPAPDDGCGDCALACTHGCCHASHVGIVGSDPVSLLTVRTRAPASWTHVAGEPPAVIGGPERPPRA